MQRIAIIGSGVSGLVAAHNLRPSAEFVLFEADDRVGGHVNTVEVHEAEQTLGIDTGFIVYNEHNYPGFATLLDDLGVATKPSDMSFSVSSPVTGLEYRGTNLNTLLARRSNVLRPSFVRMVSDVPRFNRAARALLEHDDITLSLDDFLRRERFSQPFVDDYLIPLGAAIWSANVVGSIPRPARSALTRASTSVEDRRGRSAALRGCPDDADQRPDPYAVRSARGRTRRRRRTRTQ